MPVYYNKHKRLWVARIRQGDLYIQLGTYKTQEEAQAAEEEFYLRPKPPRPYSRAWFDNQSRQQMKTLPFKYLKGVTNVPSEDCAG